MWETMAIFVPVTSQFWLLTQWLRVGEGIGNKDAGVIVHSRNDILLPWRDQEYAIIRYP